MPTLSTEWTKLNEKSVSYSPWAGTFSLWARITATDIPNNRTKVEFNWYLTTTAGYEASSNDAQDYVTGAGWNSADYRTYSGDGTLRSSEVWLSHNNDGTLSSTCYGRTRMGGIGVDTDWVEGSFDLPRIPRASVPTASPNPCTIWQGGQTLTVYTNRKVSTFTHTIKVQCGSWSWTSSARAVGASVAVPIPYTVGAQIPSASKTATATVTCTTFSGTTQIGSAQTFSVTIQINAQQDHANIGTITVEDTNSRTSAIVGEETFIYGISTLQATIPLTVSGSYTELASAVVTCGNKSQNYTLSGTSQTITFTFDKVDYNSLTVKVTDKRGNSVTATKSYTLMAYQPVTVTGTVGRVTETDSTAVGQVSGVAYGGNYGQASNELTITYKYREHNASTWTDSTYSATLTLNAGQQTYTHAITLLEEYDYQKQYDIQYIVNDLFNTATYTVRLMQGLPILSWDETEVDVWGDLHIHYREKPTMWQDVMSGFDAILAHGGQKNLMPLEASASVVYGVTFTSANGTVTTQGTASADAHAIEVFTYTGETLNCYYTGCPDGGSEQTYDCYLYDATTAARAVQWDGTTPVVSAYRSDDSKAVKMISGHIYHFVIRIRSGVNANNLTFKPMIRDGRLASAEFVPWDHQKMVVQETITVSLTNGAYTYTYPSGITNGNYYLPIIVPMYMSGGIVGWSHTLQPSGDDKMNIYVRQGTAIPANGSQIRFTAVWIHR